MFQRILDAITLPHESDKSTLKVLAFMTFVILFAILI